MKANPVIWNNMDKYTDIKILSNGIIQLQKDKHCMIPIIWGPKIVKIIEAESRVNGSCQRLWEGGFVLLFFAINNVI